MAQCTAARPQTRTEVPAATEGEPQRRVRMPSHQGVRHTAASGPGHIRGVRAGGLVKDTLIGPQYQEGRPCRGLWCWGPRRRTFIETIWFGGAGAAMAEAKGNVWMSSPPPAALLKAMNVVMKPLLSSPLGRRMKGVMLLEFNGRRSGRKIKVPVNFHLVDGVPMAFSPAPWRHNFAGGAPVTVTHRGQVRRTRGTLVPMTPEEMGEAVRKSLDTGGSAQWMMIRTARGHEASAAELAGLGPALGTSVIKFDFRP